jgi:hypothetical protein
MGFDFNPTQTESTEYKNKRITVDNKYLKKCQIKNIEDYITEDCVLYLDCDSIPYFAASLQDENYIVAKHIKSGNEKEFKNKTEFKGAGKKAGSISKSSWLGVKNLEMEAAGKTPFTLDDFEITQHKRLKRSKEESIVNIQNYIDDYLSSILKQSGCKSLVVILGRGVTFRHSVKLPEVYKGNRDQERPILLPEARKYILDNYEYIYVGDESLLEADDVAQQKGFEGYKNYRKTGKFDKMIASFDKDARGSPCLLFNYQKKGPFWEYPNPWLIEATDRSIGFLEMHDGECKATGLLQKAYQLLTNDSSDNYYFYLRFDKSMHPSTPYSDASFYKEFCLCKTPEDVLSKVVNRFYETFPSGLKYVSWDGEEMDIDTLSWAEMLFSCVHMKLADNDNSTFEKLCNRYNVSVEKIKGNNIDLSTENDDNTTVEENGDG